MPSRPLLTFDLDGAHFGLDATLVRETVWLPELTPVEEAPPYIVGMFDLREQLIPVTDLNLRFGHPARPYSLSDQVIVLEQDQMLMGLIVSEVREVVELPPEAIQPPLTFDIKTCLNANLIEGEARVGDDIVTLLDASQLVPLSQNLANADDVKTHRNTSLIAGEARVGDGIVTLLDARQLVHLPQNLTATAMKHPARLFCPEATPEQHAVYRARAKALMQASTAEEGAHLSLAVVELGGEYFGIELEAVQEFCGITHPSPIPCCPQHILGAMSLRGNLFTLIDPRAALNLPHAAPCGTKVVVACHGEQVIGVAVDEVHDVVYLRQEELQAAPAVLREQRGMEIKGTVPYTGKMMAVLDLPALLAREEWMVNETV